MIGDLVRGQSTSLVHSLESHQQWRNKVSFNQRERRRYQNEAEEPVGSSSGLVLRPDRVNTVQHRNRVQPSVECKGSVLVLL